MALRFCPTMYESSIAVKYPVNDAHAHAIYPYLGTKRMFTTNSNVQPMNENIAPQYVSSLSLYQNERLNYMPMNISAAMIMGTTFSPFQYPGFIIWRRISI